MIRKKNRAFSVVLLFFILTSFLTVRPEGAGAFFLNQIIINEIAWMGTDVSTNDEWIELYNTSDRDINLSGWSLNAQDGQPAINLTGTIAAKGYFLLERTDNESVPGIDADMIFTGALENTGEYLELRSGAGNVIDSIDATSGWPAGNVVTRATMERSNDLNWYTSGIHGGTPKASNSVICGNGIVEAGEECDDGNLIPADGCNETCEITSQTDSRPTITINETNPLHLFVNQAYVFQSVSAYDSEDGDLTNIIQYGGTYVGNIIPGTFTKTYTVTDSSGNTVTETLTIIVSPIPAATYSITPSTIKVNEDVGSILFTVSRTDISKTETIYISTKQSKNSLNQGDYVGLLNTPITFSYGETSKYISVQIIDDKTIGEKDETFGLIAQKSPTDQTAIASAAFTIVDNDPAPQIDDLIAGAVQRVKASIGGPYTSLGKGWDFNPDIDHFLSANEIKTGSLYTLSNKKQGKGLDCSGLVFWSYNSAYDPYSYNNVIKEETANQMYSSSQIVDESNLAPGDLMFYDWGALASGDYNCIQDGTIDHVSMYVGENGCTDKYGRAGNVIEAGGDLTGIWCTTVDFYKHFKYPGCSEPGFVNFGRISKTKVAFDVKTNSPIDLVVIDPDGLVVTPKTAVGTGEGLIRGIPGELYYTVIATEPDGSPKTEIYSPKLKNGAYTIYPIKHEGADADSVFSILIETEKGSQVVADDIPIQDIPDTGYGVSVDEENGISNFTPETADSLPPVTTHSINGAKGQNDWYVSAIDIALEAIDNEGGVGVKKIMYSIDNEEWQTYSEKYPIEISAEGEHVIQYYSIDFLSNQEQANILEFKIDTSAPEAEIFVNGFFANLIVTGTDKLSNITQVENDENTYTVFDEAGNFVILNFEKIKKSNRLIQAKLKNIEYSDGRSFTPENNHMIYSWNHISGNISEQNIKPNEIQSISAHYNSKKDTTIINIESDGYCDKTTYSGIKIIGLQTKDGTLNYQTF